LTPRGRQDLAALGIPSDFKQAIQTVSHRGVMRGLHFQWDPPMGKFVRCLRGGILDVVVDVRHGSPRLGDHVAAIAGSFPLVLLGGWIRGNAGVARLLWQGYRDRLLGRALPLRALGLR
jgi:hypothetical protein